MGPPQSDQGDSAAGPQALAGVKAAVVTVSDRATSGEYEDVSGPTAAALLEDKGAEVTKTVVVPDELDAIAESLRELAASGADIIITTGGTGIARRDVTPEATQEVCERLVPGIAERLRAESLKKTPYASLSRGLAGIRGKTLIVNLPGSPGGVRDGLEVIAEIGGHAIALLSDAGHVHDASPD